MSSEGDGETGNVILGISERLVTAMVPTTLNKTKKALQTSIVGKRRVARRKLVYIRLCLNSQ